MKHISILVPEGDSSLSNLEATFKMFHMANVALQKMGEKPLFDTHLVGTQKEARISNGWFSIVPDTDILEVIRTDLIIIPAIHGDYRMVVANNMAFIPWITEQYKGGAEIASFGIGAFLLASTRLDIQTQKPFAMCSERLPIWHL